MKIHWASSLVILLVAGFSTPSTIRAQDRNWWSGFYRGPSRNVWASTIYDGRLIVGGDFERIGDEDFPYMAAWDGARWSPVGDRPVPVQDGGQIRALTVYEGDLIAAGYFNHPGDYLRKYVMKWDGHEWSRLGGPFGAMIDCFAVYNGDLIAGGYFQTAEGDSCRGVARWNGAKWQRMGEGLLDDYGRSVVWTLTAHDGFLYAGGDFTHSGSALTSGIARWNGVSWGPVAQGFDGQAGTMVVYKGDLIVGGNFVRAGNTVVNGIALWNGQSWEPLGEGVGGPRNESSWPGVGALAVMGDHLFVGGVFRSAGNRAAANMAAWNGTAWTPLGVGLGEGAVYYASAMTLSPYRGSVYVGGYFGLAGGEKSQYLARWSLQNFAPSLAFFSAARQENSVVLNWRPAGSLPKDATFRVYRGAPDRDRIEIPGEFSASDGNSSFTDLSPLASSSQYWIATDAPYGTTNWFGPLSVSSIEPPTFRLAQNRPNPVRESTTFFFEVTRRSEVSLSIIDVTGRKVAEPFPSRTTDPGSLSFSWNGRGYDGNPLANGVYFYVLETGEGRESRKLIIRR